MVGRAPSALSVRPKGGLCALCVPLFWLRLADNQVAENQTTKKNPLFFVVFLSSW
jgi:hypothetical protein